MTTATEPRYAQLAEMLREKIRNSELEVGDRLPSYTEMRREYGAAPATMQRVYDILEQDNLIERRNGSGVYVAEPKRELTGNIGLLFSVGFKAPHNYFSEEVLGGVYGEAAEYLQRLLLNTSNKGWDASAYKQVDAVILSGHQNVTNSDILRLKPAFMPCVSLFTLAEGMNSVIADDYGAARIATRHLLELEHRRIAFLMTELRNRPQVLRNRLGGYQDTLEEAGLKANPHWVRQGVYHDLGDGGIDHLIQWGFEQMQEWLAKDWRELGCTALIAQNDQIAIGAMQALKEADIKVPEEVSVIGFDGTKLCEQVTPRLTSVRLPLEEMGAKAVDVTVEQIRLEQPGEQIIVLPAKLRIGESTAPCKMS